MRIDYGERAGSFRSIIKECPLYLECKVVYKQGMDVRSLDPKIQEACYPEGDLHMMYFGEIVACSED